MTVIKMVRLTQDAYDFLLEIKGEHMIKGINKTFSQIVIDLVRDNNKKYDIIQAMLAEEDTSPSTTEKWREYVSELNKLR